MTTLYSQPFDTLVLLQYREYLKPAVITLLAEHTPLTPDQVQALKDLVQSFDEQGAEEIPSRVL